MHEPRVMGGYAVIATPDTITRTRRAETQAGEVAAALAACRELEQGLLDLKFEVAVRLHDRRGLPWKTVARRFRTTEKMLHRFITDRRRRQAPRLVAALLQFTPLPEREVRRAA